MSDLQRLGKQMRSPVDPEVVALRSLIAGVAFAAGGAFKMLASRRRLRAWPKAPATVKSSYDDAKQRQILVVEFADSGGRILSAKVQVSDKQSIGLGSVVSIAYDPANPEDAFLSDYWQIGVGVIGSLMIGFVLLIASAFFYLRG